MIVLSNGIRCRFIMNSENNTLFESTENGVICHLCFRHCTILNNKTGFCGVNENRDGVLHSLVYGKPDAIQIDPIEKKPLFHVAPNSSILSIGTMGCNFRCPFCQNASLSLQKRPNQLTPMSNQELINLAKDRHISALAFTYNEPSINWLWYRDLAELAKENDMCTVMVTNGSMSKEAANEMISLIDAFNIDLKCGTNECYSSVLHGDRESVLRNIALFAQKDIWIELTTLLVTALSDSEADLAQSAQEIADIAGYSIPWHVTAYHPAHHYDKVPTTPQMVMARAELLKNEGYHYVYTGNIGGSNNTLCPKCGTLLIERSGYSTMSYMNNGKCPHCSRALEGRLL